MCQSHYIHYGTENKNDITFTSKKVITKMIRFHTNQRERQPGKKTEWKRILTDSMMTKIYQLYKEHIELE